MPKYKLVEMPDVNNVGKHKVYPKLVSHRTIRQDEFVERMQEYSRALAPSVVEAVVTDMRDMIVRLLSAGYGVSLDGLGTFSLSLGFEDGKPTEMQDDDDRMAFRRVGVRGVNFRPSPEFTRDIKENTDPALKREAMGVSQIRREQFTLEERVARALRAIDDLGFITLSGYATMNGMSRTVASEELKEICSAADSPIKSTGHHSHKVWVRRKEK